MATKTPPSFEPTPAVAPPKSFVQASPDTKTPPSFEPITATPPPTTPATPPVTTPPKTATATPPSFEPASFSQTPSSFEPSTSYTPPSFEESPVAKPLLGTIWTGLKSFGKAVVKDLAETGYRVGTQYIAKTLFPGSTSYLDISNKKYADLLPAEDSFKVKLLDFSNNPASILPEKVNIPGLGETSVRYSDNPSEKAGQLLNDSINVLSLFDLGAGSLLKVPAKQAGEQVIKNATKTFAKQQLTKAGIDFTLGAGFGLASDLKDGEKDPVKIAQDMAGTGAIVTIATPVIGALFKGAFKAVGSGSKFLDESSALLSAYLKDYSTPVVKEAGRATELMAMANPETFYNQTLGQKGAETLSKVIDWTRNLPTTIVNKVLDDMNPVRKVVNTFEKMTGTAVDPFDDAYKLLQVSDSQAFEKASKKISNYDAIKNTYPDMGEKANAYLLGLDLLERSKHGPIPNGKSAADIQRQLGDLVAQMSPEDMTKLREVQTGVRSYLDQQLVEMRDSGFLTKDAYDRIIQAHPNYIPHNVTDYITAEGGYNSGGGYSVVDGLVKRAKGSERTIEGVDSAIVRNTLVQEKIMAKNKIPSALIKMVEKDPLAGEKLGFKGLRTAEKVNKRNALLQQAADLKEAIASLQGSKEYSRTVNSELGAKIKKASGELDVLYKELEAEINALGDKETRDILFKTKAPAKTINELNVNFQTKANIENEFGSLRGLLEKSAQSNKLVPAILAEHGFAQHSIDAIMKGLEEQLVPKSPAQISKFLVDHTGAGSRVQKMIKIAGQEIDLATIAGDKTSLEKAISALSDQAEFLSGQKKSIIEQVRTLSDVNIKSIDRPNQEKVSFWRDGVREDWLVPKDVGTAMKRMDSEQIPWYLKGVESLNKMFKNLTTTYSLPFVLRNAIRDTQNATVIAKYGLLPQDWARAFADIVGEKRGNGSKYYDQWKELGGPLSGIFDDNLSPGEMFKKLERTVKSFGNQNKNIAQTVGEKVINVVPDVFRNIKAINEVTEETTRLAVFIKALENGAHPLDAVLESKNATVNFAKMGSAVRTLNKIIPFLNARIQGGTNMVKAFVADPETFIRRNMTNSLVPAMFLYSHNNKPEYSEAFNNIPQATKDLFWVFMTGTADGVDGNGNSFKVPLYVKIPKGESQQVITKIWNQMMDIHYQNDPEDWKQFVKETTNLSSPIQYSGYGPLSALPELWSNYDQFLNKPIEPDYIRGKNRNDLYAYEKYLDSTSAFAKQMAGSKDAPAFKMFGISPIQFDFMLGKTFSSVGRDVNNVYTLAENGSKFKTEDPTPWEVLSRVPVINSFISDGSYPQNNVLETIQKKNTKENNSRDLRIQDEIKPFIDKHDMPGMINTLKQNDDFQRMNMFEQEKSLKNYVNKFVKELVNKNKSILSRYDGETLYYYYNDRIQNYAEAHDTRSLVNLLKEMNDQGVPKSVIEDVAQRALLDFGYLNKAEEQLDENGNPVQQ